MTSTDLVTTDALRNLPQVQREQQVTLYLEAARDRLAWAVDMTGPEAVAQLKAEIATAAEATKQLNLSKEIQLDAAEMVRRAEYALAKAVRKGQEEGTIATIADATGPQRDYVAKRGGKEVLVRVGREEEDRKPNKISPKTYYPNGSDRHEAVALAAATEEQFEEALTAAKAEANLSRANVVRKIKNKEAEDNLAMPQPPKYGPRRNHQKRIDALAVTLSGAAMAADEITELDDSINDEEAARLMGDLSRSLKSLHRLKNLLKERTR